MIKLSKLADYSVIILAQFPEDGEGLMAASVLAEMTCVPEPTVSKILKMLASAGLMASIRGKNGGYRLNKPTKDISIVEVIEAVDGPVALTTCTIKDESLKKKPCPIKEDCKMRGCWDDVNDAILKALQDVSLADMARKCKEKACC